MKRVVHITLLIFLIVIISCDKIDNPYPKTVSVPIDTSTETHVRRVLLEDFTGHDCPNCPSAQREAEKLIKDPPTSYGDRLLVLAIHAGFFASPKGGCLTYDFRTTVGTSMDAFFKPTLYPRGMVNRKDFPANQHMKPFGSWATEIASLIDLPPDMDITIQNTYSSTNRKLDIAIESEFLTQQTGDFKIVVLLTEDSIIQCQNDAGTIVTDYVHMHVLRDAINGSGGQWGDNLTSGTINPGAKFVTNLTYTIPTSPNNIDPAHARVIAFVYDDSNPAPPDVSRYKQILQVGEAKVIE